MSSIQALRERLAALHNSMKNRLADKGEQKWSVEDQAAFDAEADDFTRTQAQLANHQKVLDQAKEDNFRDAERNPAANAQRNDLAKGLDIFLRKSFKEMSAEEVTLVRNTMSTTTGSQGGFTVQTEVSREFIDTMKDFGGMRRVADRIVTAMGNDYSFPSTDGTAEVGEVVAQNVAAASADPVFGTVPVNVVKFSSKIITVPIELLQDSQIDVMGLVQKRMRQRIGRIQNQKFSIGTGTAEPFGITVAAGVGKTGTTGQTVTVIYDDLVDLIDSVDVAYLEEGLPLQFMTSQTMRKVVRKIKDTSGRPIWTPNYDAGIAGGFVDELLGYPLNINNDMPVPAANAKSLSFGQHKNYLIRDAMDVTMFRFDDSAYMSKGQVGFLAWARAGGNLLDAASVKLYQHSAT
jgi:HK97 family phage major capsid protein